MNKTELIIVLSRPEESRNIGSVCRAMANAGLSKLRIVGKKENYDEEKVKTLAIHAVNIWENAFFYESITEATKDCTLVAGTTRRTGKKRKDILLLPEEFAKKATEISNAAVVFGNERTGLTDEELNECTMGVTIPSHPEFASLNLSHAVQIICYEYFRCISNRSPGYIPVPLNRLDKTVSTIADNLQKIGFFSVTGRTDMEQFWRNILSRSALSEGECKYLEKIFIKAAGLSTKNKN